MTELSPDALSPEELTRLVRGPHERLSEALVNLAPTEVASELLRLLGLVRDIADLYARWSVVTLGWLHDRHGLGAAALGAAVHELLPPDALPRLTPGQLGLVRDVFHGDGPVVAARATALAAGGDEAGLLAWWDEVSGACDLAEILRRDTVTAQLTLVNERYGPDGLEDCLRHAADLLWVPRMERDLAQPPLVRIRAWAEKMATGHHGSVTVTQHADRWVLTLDPCGSCRRQILGGRYAPPWDFGVVAPGHRVGFFRPDITVYQAHLAVAHTLVPIERRGAPWPAMACSGLGGGACELVIYRDPAATDAVFYEQVGATGPTR